MQLSFGYGHGSQEVSLDERRLLAVLHANPIDHVPDSDTLVRAALENPIGSPSLRDLVHPGERIAIISSDITRPMPTAQVMPAILDELYAAGIRPQDITLVLGLGIHRPHTDAERRKLAGERAFNEIAVVDSDPLKVTRLGTTSRGTPVDLDTRVAEADRRICLGNIEYHYFAGYSGGGKALMPGVSTAEAIQNNHRLMTDENARAGLLDGNPVREDIDEAAGIAGVDFILNLILDEEKRIVHAVAGDFLQAHRAGCAFLDRMYLKPIRELADIVLVSQGGAPKDLNLYQTQKALDNARHAVREGGIIILMGECGEGLGEKVFEEWIASAGTPEAMVSRIRRDFRLGGHKAAAIAMVRQRAEIFLVSALPPEIVEKAFMRPFSDAQSALDAAIEQLGEQAQIIAMPHGGSTLPRLMKGNPA